MKVVVSIIVNSIIEVVVYRTELLKIKIAIRLHLCLEDHLGLPLAQTLTR